jgi:hypothetical protein
MAFVKSNWNASKFDEKIKGADIIRSMGDSLPSNIIYYAGYYTINNLTTTEDDTFFTYDTNVVKIDITDSMSETIRGRAAFGVVDNYLSIAGKKVDETMVLISNVYGYGSDTSQEFYVNPVNMVSPTTIAMSNSVGYSYRNPMFTIIPIKYSGVKPECWFRHYVEFTGIGTSTTILGTDLINIGAVFYQFGYFV